MRGPQILQSQFSEIADPPGLQPPHHLAHAIQISAGGRQRVATLFVQPLHKVIEYGTEYRQGTQARVASGTESNQEG
jgi:hypothetical protein